jgi:hypothetical protein
MKDFFELHRGSDAHIVEETAASSVAAQDRPVPSFRFVDQLENLLGVGAEPDPLFFVDSWTIGLPAAIGGFAKRRNEQSDCQWRGQMPDGLEDFPTYSRDGVSSLTGEFLTSVRAAFADHYGAIPDGACEESAKHLPKEPVYASDSFDMEAEDCQDGHESLTIETACSLLGVKLISTRKQIRAAYRQMASRYHPDRLEHKSEPARRLATERMARINEAHQMLCLGPLKESV